MAQDSYHIGGMNNWVHRPFYESHKSVLPQTGKTFAPGYLLMDIYLLLDNCVIVPILSKLDSSGKCDFSFQLKSVEWAMIILLGYEGDFMSKDKCMDVSSYNESKAK